MNLSQIKQAIENNEKVKLKGLAESIYLFLKEEKTLEEIVEKFSDEDLAEQEIQSLFGPETEELLTQLVIEQANFLMANWILNQEFISDFCKEEIAYAFTQEYPLNGEDESQELFLSLYTKDFLTSKEKSQSLTKATQDSLLSLALHYNQTDQVLDLVKKLDNLHVSLFLQNYKVKQISAEVYFYLKDSNKLTGKNALSALTKAQVSSKEQLWLTEQALMENDADIAYFILTQLEMDNSSLKNQVIKQALRSMFFNYTSLSTRLMIDVDEYILSNNLFSVENFKDYKALVYNQRELAKYELKTETFTYNQYFSDEVIKIINQNLLSGNQTLPEIIKGFYNFQEEVFIPEDKGLNLNSIKYTLQIKSKDYNHEALKLWKPNLSVPATLKKQEKKYLLQIWPEKIDLPYNPIQAENISELQEKFKQRIAFLQESLKPLPMNSNRPFGVEIELCMNGVRPSDLALTLEGEDLYDENELAPVNSNRKSAVSSWAVKYDASVKHLDENNKPLKEINHLEQNRFTAEIITPKLYGEEGLNELRTKLNLLLQEYGDYLSVNFTCGLHVHHDMRELIDSRESYFKLLEEELAKVQESVYSLCAEHRRNNTYCPRLELHNGVQSPKIENNTGRNINIPRPGFNAWTGYGTLEFRMHEATLDVEQIVNWVRISHQITDQIINKIISVKNHSVAQLSEALKLMEIEKLKKLQNEQDLDKALAEINNFIKTNAWSQVLIKT
jgi:hypothetical protein